jgi:hypothetical protein
MSQSQSQRPVAIPLTDSADCIDIVMDGPGDTTVRPMEPHIREQIERWQQRQRESLLSDRCSIRPEKLKQLRQAAECLGRSEADLICEGLDLVYQMHRDKLGDLDNPESPGDAPKPEDNPPSA